MNTLNRVQQLEQLLRRAHPYVGRHASVGALRLSGEIIVALSEPACACDCGDPLCLRAQPTTEEPNHG